MKNKQIILIALTATIMMPLFNGCSGQNSPVKVLLPLPSENQVAQPAANSNRFQNDEQANSNAIKSAIEVSEKYAQLVSEASELRLQNKAMKKENEQTSIKLKQIQTEMEKTKKELSQANDMIMETTVELNNWKSSVLGFRDEMRQANIAQLQSLQKILVILGGESQQSLAMESNTKNQ